MNVCSGVAGGLPEIPRLIQLCLCLCLLLVILFSRVQVSDECCGIKAFNWRKGYQMFIDLCADLNATGPVQLFGFDEVGEITKREGD